MININVVGLITEYNPFHNGHKYHLDESKKKTNCDYSIAVMSGNFLQRGEPALLDKWTRAQMAVASGVDLVIELPTLYACNSAEFFAFGSTYILNATGVVDKLCFGSESGDITWLKKLAEILAKEPPEYKELLSGWLKEGHSFPRARELALTDMLGDSNPISAPNNILGLEYIKSLIQLDSNIVPETITRTKAEYNSKDITSDVCSATAIRHLLNQPFVDMDVLKRVVPSESYLRLKELLTSEHSPIFAHDLWQMLLYKLRISKESDIRNIHDVREGLENRIIRAGISSSTYDELLDSIKTKRYTETSIKRVLIKILLDITDEMVGTSQDRVYPSYIRVLSFNKKGAEILKRMKKRSTLPVITNLKNYEPQSDIASMQLDLDIRATNVYNLASKGSRVGGQDYRITPRPL